VIFKLIPLLFLLASSSYAIENSIGVAACSTRLNVRAKASSVKGTRILGKLNCRAKEKVDIVGEEKNFYKVVFKNSKNKMQIGYVSKDYISVVDAVKTVVDTFKKVSGTGEPPECPTCDGHQDDGSGNDVSSEELPKDGDALCNYPERGASWIKNCNKLFTNSEIPRDALKYTMQAFKHNYDKFRNKNCYLVKKNLDHPSMGGLTIPRIDKIMEKGLPNKCQIVINDTRERPKICKDEDGREWSCKNRGIMYYIDICKGTTTKTYFNMGLGKKFQNISGKNSTVKGVFITGKNSFNFTPGKRTRKKYRRLREKQRTDIGQYKAHAVQLYGLQKTNNGAAEDGKYMHVSPLFSSFGCPSIDRKNYKMIEELAYNGPSMVVNYAEGMQDIKDVDSCGPRKRKPVRRKSKKKTRW